MGEFLLSWISKSPLDQGLTLVILLLFLAGAGFIIVKIIANLKKRKLTPTATLNADGIRLGVDSETDQVKVPLSSMEQRLLDSADVRNEKQEAEIEKLRKEIDTLREELQELKVQLGIKVKIDEDNKKNLIPFTQHTMFANLKTSMERGIDFPYINNEEYKRKIYLGKVFIQECRSPTLYYTFKDFIDNLEKIANDTEKVKFMFSFPDALYDAIDKYCEIAYNKELIINNISIKGIPVCFVNKYKQFTQPHVDLLANKIKSVLYSSFYRTWQLKLIMILDVMDTVFSLVTHELLTTINTLNGEVDRELEEKIEKAKCQ